MTQPSNVDLWRRAEVVFATVVDRSPEERDALLRHACGKDHELRGAVEALLTFDDSDFLETPLVNPVARLGGEPISIAPGASLGRYRLMRLLGEGGMSRVFLAERADAEPFQTVAVKLIRDGRVSLAGLRRLRRERRILAALQHPNIARLLDGGTADNGEPYAVMEYVAGLPFTRYCDERCLTIRERLRLFCTVCDAVQYAHANLVIHGDIKPSNILVTERGEPKLLDFGSARGPFPVQRLPDDPTTTQERALTPEYASPEQLAGAPLTTATDVYSLGVVLHELLVGRRPAVYFPAVMSGEADASEEFRPPSAFVAHPARWPQPGTSAEVSAIAAARGASPRQLRRQVVGDLDNILRRALNFNADARYPSVEQLSHDVARHLDGRPVAARPPRLIYRTRKFIHRHAAAVAFGSLALLSLVALCGGLLFQGARVRRERDAARLERQRAEDERQRAEEVTQFLVDAFALADPHEVRGQTITAREILDRSAKRVTSELKDDPALQGTLLNTIGRVYTNLGLYDPARATLEDALARRGRANGTGSVEVAETLTHLGLLHHARGDDTSAESAFREALALRRKALGDDHARTAESLAHVGYILRDRGEYAAAEPLIRKALAVRRKHLGEHHIEVATNLMQLAILLHRAGKLDEAERFFREAVNCFERNGHEDHPSAAAARAGWAWLLDEKGDLAGAETQYRKALALRVRVFGGRHPEVASLLNDLAATLRNKGDYTGAEAAARRAVELSREVLPPGHPNGGAALMTLGLTLRDKDEPAAAEPLLREALATGRRAYGAEDPDVLTALSNLGTVLADGAKYAEAEQTFDEALALRRRLLGPNHWQVGHTLTHLADVKRARGRYREAHALATQAMEILSAALPAGHWRTATARSVLGDCLVSLGRLDEARPLLLESIDVIRATQGTAGYSTRRAQQRVARYEAARRLKPERAAALHQRANASGQ